MARDGETEEPAAVQSAWSHPAIRGLWGSRMSKAFAVDLLTLSLSWAATSLPDAAAALAIVNVPGRIAETLSSYLSGWLADRFSAPLLMTLGNLLLACVALCTGLFLRSHATLWALVAGAVLFRAVQPVSQTASRAALPRLVEDRNLPTVNAQMSSVNLLRQVGGTVLAGFLVALGLFHALLAATGLGLGAALLALLTPGLSLGPVRASQPPAGRSQAGLQDGFAIVWNVPALRYAALTAGGLNLGWSFFLAEYVLYARSVLHLGAPMVGLLGGLGTGGVALGIALGPRLMRQHLGLGLTAIAPILATGMALIAALPSPWTFGFGMAVLEFGESLAGQSLGLVRQRFAPKDRMGSVVGVLGLIGGVTVPVGFAVAGFIAVLLGSRTAIATGSALLLLSSWPALRLKDAVRHQGGSPAQAGSLRAHVAGSTVPEGIGPSGPLALMAP